MSFNLNLVCDRTKIAGTTTHPEPVTRQFFFSRRNRTKKKVPFEAGSFSAYDLISSVVATFFSFSVASSRFL